MGRSSRPRRCDHDSPWNRHDNSLVRPGPKKTGRRTAKMAHTATFEVNHEVGLKSTRLTRRVVELVPGLLLLTAVGYAGKFVEHFIATYGKAHHLVLPNIEYVLWAILFGLVISNTIGL